MPDETAVNIPGAPSAEPPAVVEPTAPREPLPPNLTSMAKDVETPVFVRFSTVLGSSPGDHSIPEVGRKGSAAVALPFFPAPLN